MTLAEVMVGAALAGVAGTIGLGLFIVVGERATDTTTREQLASETRTALTQVSSELQYADSPTANKLTAEGRFQVFAPGKITFYTNRDNASRSGSLSRTPPSRVTIEKVDVKDNATKPAYAKRYDLVLKVWAPTVKYGTAGNPYRTGYDYTTNYPAESSPTQTMVLAHGIANDTAKPDEAVFTYCSSNPDPAPATATPSASPSASTPTTFRDCDRITTTGIAATDAVQATRISSVIVRLKVVTNATRTSQTDYQPASWLTTRVAVSGRVEAAPAGGS